MIFTVIIAGLAFLQVIVLCVFWLITLNPAGAVTWAIRRLGYVPLTDEEITELEGGRPVRVTAPAGMPAWVPPTQRVITDRVTADGAPPWDPRWSRDTRAQAALTAPVERDLLARRLAELGAPNAPAAPAAAGGDQSPDPVTGTSKETAP